MSDASETTKSDMGIPITTRWRNVTVPDACPHCGADAPENCLDCGHCIVNRIAPLTPEDLAWAVEKIEQMEARDAQP